MKRIRALKLLAISLLTGVSTLNAQSYGPGAVSKIFHKDGMELNVGGNLNIDHAIVLNSMPEVRLSWDWLKVHSIKYKGVDYSETNNPMGANFGYIKDSYWGDVTLSLIGGSTYIKNTQDITQAVYTGNGANYTFDRKDLSQHGPEKQKEIIAKFKEDWLDGFYQCNLTLKSIDGSAIRDVVNKVKMYHAKKEKEALRRKEEAEREKRQQAEEKKKQEEEAQRKKEEAQKSKASASSGPNASTPSKIPEKDSDGNASVSEQKEKEDGNDKWKSSQKITKSYRTNRNDQTLQGSSGTQNNSYSRRDNSASVQRQANQIVRQAERNVQQAQQNLGNWNNMWENVAAGQAAQVERERAEREQRRREEEARRRREQAEYRRREREREEQWRREREIANNKKSFMQGIKDISIPLDYPANKAFVLFVSKVGSDRAILIPSLIYKRQDGRMPFQQEVKNSVLKRNKLNKVSTHGIYKDFKDLESEMIRLVDKGLTSHVDMDEYDKFEYGKAATNVTTNTDFWGRKIEDSTSTKQKQHTNGNFWGTSKTKKGGKPETPTKTTDDGFWGKPKEKKIKKEIKNNDKDDSSSNQ